MIKPIEDSNLLRKIKTLSELEFSALLKEMSEHMRKNNWGHIIDECFDIETFEEELDEMKYDYNELSDEKDDLIDKVDRAITALDNLDPDSDDLQKEIDKIRDGLS